MADLVTEGDTSAMHLFQPGMNDYLIAIAGWGMIASMCFRDREKVTLLLPLYIVLPAGTKVLATSYLEPDEVVGMVDDAHGVCLGVTDAEGHLDGAFRVHVLTSRNTRYPARFAPSSA
jgi:hypothetical protein